MAAVKQQVLNWLYSVLTGEYKDVNRTYNDVAQTLAHHSSLSPRKDVYTFDNGASALLLHLSGTLPVTFRGTTYRFPIALWVPHGYPLEAPLVYVIPTETMMVRPGQHVDPQGKVYHPYLLGWAEFWDKSNIVDFLAILRDVFAKDPPVISRQPQNPPRPPPAAVPPPVPPPPPGAGHASPILTHRPAQSQPPPPPPKPSTNSAIQAQPQPSRWRQSGPPLPPLPSQTGSDGNRYVQQIRQPPNGQSNTPQSNNNLRYENAPPLPAQIQRQQALKESPNSPVSPVTPPQDPYMREPYSHPYQQPQNASNPMLPPNQHYRGQLLPSYQPQQPYPQPPQPQWQTHPPRDAGQRLSHPQPHSKRPPQTSLLDAPLTLTLPSSSNLPAPPIPPNPEKDLLLHNIARTLHTQRQHILTQSNSSLPGLSAQRTAMLTALANMQAEKAALENLHTLLSSNTTILHTALRNADAVIESGQHRKAPNVDELLVAPTVVGNQLYELVSEERSLGDALFVLGRAVERGRISPAVFTKMTRSLAREWYLKKALVKKIGRGMGLATY